MISNALLTGLVNFALFGVVAVVRRVLNKEGLKAFLLSLDRRGLSLLAGGLLAGALGIALYAGIARLGGVGHMRFSLSGIPATLEILLAWGFGFLGAALFEEGLFRGYLLLKLLGRVPTWLAVLFSSLLFGVLHLPAYAASPTFWIGLGNAALLGVLLSVLVLRTQSLMGAVGFHLAWNLVQTELFSASNYGVTTLANFRIQPDLWTGTPFTPESGLIVTAVLAVMLWSISVPYEWFRPAEE